MHLPRLWGVVLAAWMSVSSPLFVRAEKCGGGRDMGPDDKLRIGVLSRNKKCTRRSTTGDELSMHYTGVLFKDCTQFDSSVGRYPFTFTLGAGEVIEGWDKGLLGMCEGEKRRLTIPSRYAYGEGGISSDIPPGATLVFDVELLKIS